MIKIKRSKYSDRGHVDGQRVLRKRKRTQRRTIDADPPRTGLWAGVGNTAHDDVRFIRERSKGSVSITRSSGEWLEEHGRLVYAPHYEVKS